MLSYLHACAAAGIVVTGYTDEAHGTMTETTDGGGHFIEVGAQATGHVASPDMIDKAAGLHREAHEKCFMASSVDFPRSGSEPVVLACSGRELAADPARWHERGGVGHVRVERRHPERERCAG